MKDNKIQSLFDLFDEYCMILQNLKENKNISLIEKDIALEKLRGMYMIFNQEHALIKEPGNEGAEKVSDDDIFSSNVDVKKQEEIELKEEIVLKEEEPKESEPEAKVNKGDDQFEVRSKKDIIGERYKGNNEYINEKISKNHPANDMSVKLQSRPISDIGKAIGLNDKFLYINELFKGDSALYKNTLDRINSSNDFNDAFSFLNDQFGWDMKEDSAQKFMELVRRKFISPEK